MNAVRVTRGTNRWFVEASSAESVREVCSEQGWEFDNIEDAPSFVFKMFKRQGIGELIDEIGPINHGTDIRGSL